MEALKEKILTEGKAIGTEIVKVDGFLNHQIDVKFLEEIAEEFKRRFDDVQVDKILTVEASGIAIAPKLPVPPEMKMVFPACASINSSACIAVSAVSGTAAASSSVRYSGVRASADSSTATYSANAPMRESGRLSRAF